MPSVLDRNGNFAPWQRFSKASGLGKVPRHHPCIFSHEDIIIASLFGCIGSSCEFELLYCNVKTLLMSLQIWLTKSSVSEHFMSFAQVCMLCSVGYHLFCCHRSEKNSRRWMALDYAGISIGIIGCYVPGVFYAFYCNNVRCFSQMLSDHSHNCPLVNNRPICYLCAVTISLRNPSYLPQSEYWISECNRIYLDVFLRLRCLTMQ